jgi:hypothetical protein
MESLLFVWWLVLASNYFQNAQDNHVSEQESGLGVDWQLDSK